MLDCDDTYSPSMYALLCIPDQSFSKHKAQSEITGCSCNLPIYLDSYICMEVLDGMTEISLEFASKDGISLLDISSYYIKLI